MWANSKNGKIVENKNKYTKPWIFCQKIGLKTCLIWYGERIPMELDIFIFSLSSTFTLLLQWLLINKNGFCDFAVRPFSIWIIWFLFESCRSVWSLSVLFTNILFTKEPKKNQNSVVYGIHIVLRTICIYLFVIILRVPCSVSRISCFILHSWFHIIKHTL